MSIEIQDLVEAEHKTSFKTDTVKKRVEWLLKMLDEEYSDLNYDDFMSKGFGSSCSAGEFLVELIKAGAVNENVLIALMDKLGFFIEIDADAAEIDREKCEQAGESGWIGSDYQSCINKNINKLE